jgi:hypothetical protein
MTRISSIGEMGASGESPLLSALMIESGGARASPHGLDHQNELDFRDLRNIAMPLHQQSSPIGLQEIEFRREFPLVLALAFTVSPWNRGEHWDERNVEILMPPARLEQQAEGSFQSFRGDGKGSAPLLLENFLLRRMFEIGG